MLSVTVGARASLRMHRPSADSMWTGTLTDFASLAVVPGDVVVAVGTLTRAPRGHVLTAHMAGLYGELGRELGVDTARVTGLTNPPLDEVVTVRGVWTGSEIEEPEISEGQAGIGPPPSFNPDAFSEVPGTAARSEVLRPEVLWECDALRGDVLVSFVAVPGPHGWFGLASAVDVEVVAARLGALLSPYLLVTKSEWTLSQLQEIERRLGEAKQNLRNVGSGWDTRGRYRVKGLLHHLLPELAASLSGYPRGSVHVDVWLRPVREPRAGSRAGAPTNSPGAASKIDHSRRP